MQYHATLVITWDTLGTSRVNINQELEGSKILDIDTHESILRQFTTYHYPPPLQKKKRYFSTMVLTFWGIFISNTTWFYDLDVIVTSPTHSAILYNIMSH